MRKQATNGSGKAVPNGTFDRARKGLVGGLGLAPASSSGTEKDIPMTCFGGDLQAGPGAGENHLYFVVPPVDQIKEQPRSLSSEAFMK